MAYIGNDPSNRFVAPKAASVSSGDGSTTASTLDHAVGSDEDILVSVDGVIQEPSVAYAVSSGTTLTFTAAPSSNSGNNIFVYYLFRTVGTVSHPSNNALQASDITVDTTTLVTDSTNNRVGIGTASPENNLHIFTDANAEGMTIKSTGNTSNAIIIDANRSSSTQTINQFLGKWNGTDVAEMSFQTGTDTSNKDDGLIKFRTSKTGSLVEVMRITQNNNVAIGTTTEFAKLHVTSQGDVTTPALFEDTRTGSTSTTCIVIKRNGSNVGAINTTNTSTAYVESSDYRLKENVEYDWDATTRLKQLKPARFNFIADADTTVDGFLAHEVSSVVPEAVSGEKDAVDADGNIEPQGIDKSKIVPLLVKSLQEALAEIDTLKTKVAALENA